MGNTAKKCACMEPCEYLDSDGAKFIGTTPIPTPKDIVQKEMDSPLSLPVLLLHRVSQESESKQLFHPAPESGNDRR